MDIFQADAPYYIPHHIWSSSGCKTSTHGILEAGNKTMNRSVLGSEIMSPFRNAMSLINCNRPNVPVAHPRFNIRVIQALW